MAPNNTTDSSGSSSLSQAADRIRESAKWLIVSFAAVGVILYGGLQLASLGKLSTDQPVRLTAAGIGVLLGLTGLAVAIAAASSVVTKSYVSLQWLKDLRPNHPIRTEIESDKSLLGGHSRLEDLASQLSLAQERRLRAYQNRYAPAPTNESPADRDARIESENKEFAYADNWLASLTNTEDNVLQVASFNRVAHAYEKARKNMFIGAGLAAAGIALFAWGANPPALVTAEQVLPPSPSDVTVVVSSAARDLPRVDLGGRSLQQLLGKTCDLSAVQAVAVGAEGSSYQVVSLHTDKCQAAFFTISPVQGRLIPRKP